MLVNKSFRKLLASVSVLAVIFVSSSFALAAPGGITGEITVTGQVSVNGQSAVSNATIVSGSTIVTEANSSAVISLGKLGRVELLADSNIVLNFSESSITGVLSSGKARVSNAAGVATTITTKDTAVLADVSQAASFLVEVECSHTHVDTTAGMVVMREGTTDKQIAAGTSATAGNLAQTNCQPCFRPNSAPPVAIGGWPWLLLIAAGAAGAAILLGGDNEDPGGPTIVVSPTR